MEISGKVENPVRFSLKGLYDLKDTQISADIHCVTTWSLFDTSWEGVLFKDLCTLVGPKPEAKHVLIKAKSKYSTNLPIQDAYESNVIIATKYDNLPIEPKHGAPLRLVVPHKYAYKSCKWVTEIVFLENEELGYWEQRGYSNQADPWKEQRYSNDK